MTICTPGNVKFYRDLKYLICFTKISCSNKLIGDWKDVIKFSFQTDVLALKYTAYFQGKFSHFTMHPPRKFRSSLVYTKEIQVILCILLGN